MHNKTIKELSALLHSKQVSSTELTQHFLDRIAASGHNAFLHVDPALSLAQAAAADVRLAEGTAGPLTGVPIAHKDIFVTRDWRTTAGSKMLANYVSPFDATVVDRFNAAGMVTLGKVNCDEFAMGSANENSAFGPVKNPWDALAVPGGSSGGSAAAIAARLAPAATATDTGGSIRQPAAFCGVTGIKPTYGRVSRFGMIAFASSLDQGGPMAQTAEDCALLLNEMVGHDERDSTSLTPEQGNLHEDFARDLDKPLNGLRIGVPSEYFGEGLAADVESAVRAALEQFVKLGATLVDISLPKTALSIPTYYIIAPAEASSNLSRFDGVRYGHRASAYKDLADMYKKTRAEGFGGEVQRRIMVGTYVLCHGYYDAYYVQAQKIRRLIADDFQAAFADKCDVIMGPVAPTVAWDAGSKTNDPVANYLADIFTLSTSLAGLPGMSIPCGFGSGEKNDKRPVGLQIIGNYFAEAKLLNVAHQYQLATDWHQRAPAGV
ncbi:MULTISPECIES: Asp-tRNA(Asn)/Glu-tRNA(Gln) amidotransferase subunit GatA [unclassified Massilia]|uniref:Asp-tRNA(Asn)/Glu-tRNA(Gln) amidotransferase subunit GatA n=1 Tax=unclassified Massilia TaxID=2609279 RepID=UPI001783FEAE|nr:MULTISPECIES: Asp-tRNA(Asn)/Glu-tRNA(Gln) amidotransferase subunit GatA [unclassified Massilia]MBD8530601.1 Asp-tRNA(Asn)/Glu-tRNA(Gln) amidotransferase subunit GatA [Massilia sp. CFBP 13647]MBD8674825.1 Asp-tRNA(Asn)/Glu-tRNA(Gln) amidotransferase subunit GatA [Massilia sp. CFBP 13721]